MLTLTQYNMGSIISIYGSTEPRKGINLQCLDWSVHHGHGYFACIVEVLTFRLSVVTSFLCALLVK